MDDSTTPKPPKGQEAPWHGPEWAAFSPTLPAVVALSGGADSTALLLACHERWPTQVAAIHINHGLQTAAAAFETHCTHLCQNLGVALHIERVAVPVRKGDSVEQVARTVRYDALCRVVKTHWPLGASVLLAQHADDQVETILLALLRGAGLPGLAAMPEAFERQGVPFRRPWLQVRAASIREWLRSQGQSWVEDPSNQDWQHTRNRIRHALGPVLEAQFPAHRQTMARSARHAAQAQSLLQEMAQSDLAQCGHPPQIKRLQALSPARLANALRQWLTTQGLKASTAQLDELVAQIQDCTTRAHRIEIKVGEGQVVRKGEALVGYNLPLRNGRAPS